MLHCFFLESLLVSRFELMKHPYYFWILFNQPTFWGLLELGRYQPIKVNLWKVLEVEFVKVGAFSVSHSTASKHRRVKLQLFA